MIFELEVALQWMLLNFGFQAFTQILHMNPVQIFSWMPMDFGKAERSN